MGECPTRICKESELQSNHQIGPLSPLYLNKISYESAPSRTKEKKKKKKVENEKLGKYPTDNIDFFCFFFVNDTPYSRIGLPLIYFFSLLLILTVKISSRLVFLFECRLVCPAIYLLLLKIFLIRSPRLHRARPSALLLSHPIYLFPPIFLYRYPIVFECCYDFLQIYLFR